jgi:hypothetical protein
MRDSGSCSEFKGGSQYGPRMCLRMANAFCGSGFFTTSRQNLQSLRIITLLRSARGAWVPLPEVLALGIAQYNARIFELRKRGLNIENRTESIDGIRHSWFRLVDSPAAVEPKLEPPKPSQKWADRPRLTGLPLFDLGVRP